MIKDNRDGGGSIGAFVGCLFFGDCGSEGAVGISGVVSGIFLGEVSPFLEMR